MPPGYLLREMTGNEYCLINIDLPAVSRTSKRLPLSRRPARRSASIRWHLSPRRAASMRCMARSDSARAVALNGVIATLAIGDPAKLARVESYVSMLDALSESVRQQKIVGHRTVKAPYLQLDDVPRIRQHADAMSLSPGRLEFSRNRRRHPRSIHQCSTPTPTSSSCTTRPDMSTLHWRRWRALPPIIRRRAEPRWTPS